LVTAFQNKEAEIMPTKPINKAYSLQLKPEIFGKTPNILALVQVAEKRKVFKSETTKIDLKTII